MSHFPREWAYDKSAVKVVRCLKCGEPIGDEEYVEEQMIARLGQMFFYHKRCQPQPTAPKLGRKAKIRAGEGD